MFSKLTPCSPIRDSSIPQFLKPCGQDDMLSEDLCLVGHYFDLRVQIGDSNCWCRHWTKNYTWNEENKGCPVKMSSKSLLNPVCQAVIGCRDLETFSRQGRFSRVGHGFTTIRATRETNKNTNKAWQQKKAKLGNNKKTKLGNNKNNRKRISRANYGPWLAREPE